jgi:putative transcriptional regulator
MKSLEGHLLIASPRLLDPNFFRTVVLMVRHDEDGALGLVLNKPSSKSVRELWEQISSTPCEHNRLIHIGGPVSGPLMALHDEPSLSEVEVLPGVYFTSDSQQIEELIARKGVELTLFYGYAGWGEGQLESELATGSWYTLPAKREHILAGESAMELWREVLAEVQKQFFASTLRIQHLPDEPELN